MAGLQSPGIGSGLDVNSIVSQLMAIEQRPLLQLAQKEAQVQAEISAYGTLKGALSSLQSSLGKLKEQSTFQATAASSSDDEVFTVSSDTDAVDSAYDVTVNRLAQRHKLGSSEFAGDATFGGAAGDELTITLGTTGFTLDLSTAKTLEEIQAAINVSANETGVSAGIITGDSGKKTLVLTAEETGYDNRVQLSYAGAIDASTFKLSTRNRDSGGVLLASDTELDASLLVDGVTVTRGSNGISDAVEGLTLTLEGEGRALATISRDTSVATKAVSGFVAAYNGLRSQLSGLSAGSLSGNSILVSIESRVRGVLNQAASGPGSFSYIQELGVTTGETGDLELDAEVLESALEDDLDSLLAFFTDEDSGFGTRLDKVLEGFLRTDGTVEGMIDGANNRIDGIERSRDSLERRLEITEQRLRDQFTALDGLVAQLTTTSDFLTRQLAVLPDLFMNNDG